MEPRAAICTLTRREKGRSSMTERSRWWSGWRGVTLLVVGVFMGATLITPAVAHVGGTLNHLWGAPNHIRDKVRAFGDPRWINATEAAGGDLSGTFADLQINDSAVGSPEIAFGAVLTGEIGDGQVLSADITNETVTQVDIATGGVASSEIADGSVGAAEVGLVLGTPVASEILPGGSEGNGDANTASADAACGAGQEIIGVSVDWSPDPGADDELYIVESRRLSSTSWRVWGANDTSFDATFTLTALCLA
jgi:hypothetical protein